MRPGRLWVTSCAFAGALIAAPAAAEPGDQAALDLAREAIEIDYLATSFAQAAQKLEQALSLCEKDTCAPAVKAQIHRDLGVVVLALKDPERAKQQFVQALKTDAAVTLNPDLATPEARRLFDEARVIAGVPAPEPPPEPAHEPPAAPEQAPPEKPPAPEPPVVKEKADCPPNFPGCGTAGKVAEPLDPGARNWLSLGVQQDLSLLSGDNAACSPDSDYDCFFESGELYSGIPFDRGIGQDGNVVSGGLRRSTLRLLAGYDRFFGTSFGVGVRLGWAFLGGPKAPDGSAFLPLHGEARLTYVFGERPLAQRGLRGFVHVAGGVAQVDAEVSVTLYQNDQDFAADRRTTLDAWKKSGFGFAALGGGVMYAIAPSTGPYVDVRVMQLFGLSGTTLSPQLGWAYGL